MRSTDAEWPNGIAVISAAVPTRWHENNSINHQSFSAPSTTQLSQIQRWHNDNTRPWLGVENSAQICYSELFRALHLCDASFSTPTSVC